MHLCRLEIHASALDLLPSHRKESSNFPSVHEATWDVICRTTCTYITRRYCLDHLPKRIDTDTYRLCLKSDFSMLEHIKDKILSPSKQECVDEGCDEPIT